LSFYQHLFPSPNIDTHGKYVLISWCAAGFGHALTIAPEKQGFNVLAGIYNTENKFSLTERLSSWATPYSVLTLLNKNKLMARWLNVDSENVDSKNVDSNNVDM
jgi:hypothetical protein